jgi:hypothetical protein
MCSFNSCRHEITAIVTYDPLHEKVINHDLKVAARLAMVRRIFSLEDLTFVVM